MSIENPGSSTNEGLVTNSRGDTKNVTTGEVTNSLNPQGEIILNPQGDSKNVNTGEVTPAQEGSSEQLPPSQNDINLNEYNENVREVKTDTVVTPDGKRIYRQGAAYDLESDQWMETRLSKEGPEVDTVIEATKKNDSSIPELDPDVVKQNYSDKPETIKKNFDTLAEGMQPGGDRERYQTFQETGINVNPPEQSITDESDRAKAYAESKVQNEGKVREPQEGTQQEDGDTTPVQPHVIEGDDQEGAQQEDGDTTPVQPPVIEGDDQEGAQQEDGDTTPVQPPVIEGDDQEGAQQEDGDTTPVQPPPVIEGDDQEGAQQEDGDTTPVQPPPVIEGDDQEGAQQEDGPTRPRPTRPRPTRPRPTPIRTPVEGGDQEGTQQEDGEISEIDVAIAEVDSKLKDINERLQDISEQLKEILQSQADASEKLTKYIELSEERNLLQNEKLDAMLNKMMLTNNKMIQQVIINQNQSGTGPGGTGPGGTGPGGTGPGGTGPEGTTPEDATRLRSAADADRIRVLEDRLRDVRGENTFEQRSAQLGRELLVLQEIMNNRPLTDQEKIQYFELMRQKEYIDNNVIAPIEQENERKRKRKEKIIRWVAGAAGVGIALATPAVGVAAVIGVTVGGRFIGKQIAKWGDKLRAKSNSLKYEDRSEKTDEECAQLDKKIRRKAWWADRLGEAGSVLIGGSTGYGIGSAIQNIFGWGQGTTATPETPVGDGPTGPDIPSTPEAPPVPENPIGAPPPEVATEGVLVQNGRVNLPGSAWNGNLGQGPAQEILTGGINNHSNYAGGIHEMAASKLESDLIANGINRTNLFNNLETPQVHQLLNRYVNAIQGGNPTPSFTDALQSVNPNAVDALLGN